MKRTSVLLIFMLFVMMACDNKKEQPTAFEMANLDTSVKPVDNFYQYACGGWMKNHPIPGDQARYGVFDKLREDNQRQVQDLIQELSATQSAVGSISQKISDMYNIAMDTTQAEAQGFEPIKEELESIAGITTLEGVQAKVAQQHRDGQHPFFNMYVYADDMNSDINIVHINQSGLSMPDRDYYLSTDERMKTIREKYEAYVANLFAFTGVELDAARKNAATVMKLETELARISKSKTDLRKPEENYNKKTLAELEALVPKFDWAAYFQSLGLSGVKDLNVAQLDFVRGLNNVFAHYSVDELKTYLSWQLINSAARYLSKDFYMASFEFYGKTLSGKQEIEPRWKMAVNVTNGMLGEAVGKIYVEKYFPPQAKERMLSLVANLQDALGERIQHLEWMSDETKVKALDKLSTFHVKIGYPDKWKDYTTLEIKNDSFWGNVVRSNHFDFDDNVTRAGKPVDKDEWLMSPQTVNAYYNPATNEICFPAAILQPPFFYLEADDALNYGAIGVVIGHEMTHGFDDQGRKFDKNGNLTDWWTADDAKRFDERAKVMVDFFNNIVVLNDVHANGELTLGENIADNGGLQVSFLAFQRAKALAGGDPDAKLDGFTAEQRFFLAYANLWASNVRDEEILRLTNLDPHSLGKWRVNGALPHVQAFYDAFGVKEGDGMYLPVSERADIW